VTVGDEIKKAQAAGDLDTSETYYHHWLNTLEQIVAEKVSPMRGSFHARGTPWKHACARPFRHQPR
jgi:hypothetical protein